MILRGIHVEHWRCIERLDLEDLPAGIIVLYGPNRTGKSSLVRALRACLFDADHDKGGKEFVKNIPWNSTCSPKVSIEFATGGGDYRLTKVFSKRADGKALLEKKADLTWRIEENSPKEAARKVHDLLGADKSTAGLNQLLWLDQGDIWLPEASRIDSTLEQKLVSVLGVLVTGRDLAFKHALDKRCERWFTPGGKYKQNSEVNRWEEELGKRQQHLDEQQHRFREVEHFIEAMEDSQNLLPQLQRDMALSRQEVELLNEECQRSAVRWQQYQQAKHDVQLTQRNFEAALGALAIFQETKARWREAELEAARAEQSLRAKQEERDALVHQHGSGAQQLHLARLAEQEHYREREEIDDRRKLLWLAEQQEQLRLTIERARRLQEYKSLLEVKVQELLAPDPATMDQLRRNRRDAATRQAELQAEALTVALTVQLPQSVSISIDGRQAQSLEIPALQRRAWPFHENVSLSLPAYGLVEIARSQADLDLERVARELAELERAYRETILSYRGQPEDETCLDRMAQRLVEKKGAVEKIAEIQGDLQEIAPAGLGALEKDLEKGENQRRLLLERRPDLSAGTPTEEELANRERGFQTQLVALQRTRQQWETTQEQARKSVDLAEERLQQCRDDAIATRTTAKHIRDELGRLGDELTLQAALEQAQQKLEAAQRRLAQTELTCAEKSVEQRYQDAETALQQRQERLRQLEDELVRLRGCLQASEGLHLKLADAEAAVAEANEKLARERLEAEAHRRLRELFEQCRENQVQRVMGPIAERVLDWAKRVGLDDYHAVEFGDRFFPEGIVLGNGAAAEPISLADESYGTAEQLCLLVRLALGGVLAKEEPVVAILDDPLAHADSTKHRRILDVIRVAAEGNAALHPPAGPMQILILTCHPDRFDYLTGAHHIDLAKQIVRHS